MIWRPEPQTTRRANAVAGELLPTLAAYHPLWVGTFPLGLEVPGSDLDVACCAKDLTQFDQCVTNWWGEQPRFQTWKGDVRAVETSIVRFELAGFPVELFAQSVQSELQFAHRHLVVERRLLELGGEVLRQAVRQLKLAGLKTEPAFAHVLDLGGEPYDAILQLEQSNTKELKQLLRHL